MSRLTLCCNISRGFLLLPVLAACAPAAEVDVQLATAPRGADAGAAAIFATAGEESQAVAQAIASTALETESPAAPSLSSVGSAPSAGTSGATAPEPVSSAQPLLGAMSATAEGVTEINGGIEISDAGGATSIGDLDIRNAELAPGYVAWRWAIGIGDPRGIALDPEGNVLVVSRAESQIVSLWDNDGDGVSSLSERRIIASKPGITHSVVVHDSFVYASSDAEVYRFTYTCGRTDLTPGYPVVTSIPSGGRHAARTLFVKDGYLYITVGSGDDVDEDSARAAIRRFPVDQLDPSAPISFTDGELFADGLRAEVGVALDSDGRVWGVENGRDDLAREDLGGDIAAGNPGEELNLFQDPGLFYGYPYCWSEGELAGDVGKGPGTQWADPDNTTHDDAWCQDSSNVVAPKLVLPAHTEPLGLLFYEGRETAATFTGDALVTLHGWSEEYGVGYGVFRIEFDAQGEPTGAVTPLLAPAATSDLPGPDGGSVAPWTIRPVGMVQLPDGTLLVTSDGSDEIIAIAYRP